MRLQIVGSASALPDAIIWWQMRDRHIAGADFEVRRSALSSARRSLRFSGARTSNGAGFRTVESNSNLRTNGTGLDILAYLKPRAHRIFEAIQFEISLSGQAAALAPILMQAGKVPSFMPA